MLKEWAYNNGLADRYEAYRSEVEDLRAYYADHTDDLELAKEELQACYPELFGGDDE